MRDADWLLIEEALDIMLAHVEPLGHEPVELDDALGRTLAAPVISPIDQPPWDNSAMDGYAVHAADIRGAGAAAPVTLRVVDDIRAGGFPRVPIARGEASRIMTGAPVPAGADTVVRIEHTRLPDPLHVQVLADTDAARNIRLRGEDIEAGSTVLAAGRLLRPPEVGVLAMVGCTRPLVARRPRVALLATGDELVEADRIADVVAGTHIVNSNTPALRAALRAANCVPAPLGIARDELDELRSHIERALDADALVTTAGASVGEHDLVKAALEAVGCRTLFWRVRIRPGSPFSFGLIDRPGRRPLPVFSLPGNPVSVLVTFEILVRPVLRRLQGRSAVYAPTIPAIVGEAVRSPPGLVRFLRVRLQPGADGVPRAHLTGPQGSGILTSVAAADGLLVVPLPVQELAAGTAARVVPLRGADDAIETMGFSSGG
jgi:molybdopterin molybdotransferase